MLRFSKILLVLLLSASLLGVKSQEDEGDTSPEPESEPNPDQGSEPEPEPEQGSDQDGNSSSGKLVWHLGTLKILVLPQKTLIVGKVN